MISSPLFNRLVVSRLFFSSLRGRTKPENSQFDKELIALADLRRPHNWFPLARNMNRRVIAHVGPTNSGKTYSALLSMKDGRKGVYCGPLRLLAWQIYEQLNGEGLPCDLVTGQERTKMNAPNVSCTIEMVDLNQFYDVAVIDEFQFCCTSSRGWAWTRAILGLQAKEIHVCGEERALPALERLCKLVGDELEVKKYERLCPLKVHRSHVPFSDLSPGDCVVAFSRRDVLSLKKHIESIGHQKNLKCSVIYGNLPPEARQLQAKRFNERLDGTQVLVATDAVGMGLNLSIRRIVFSSLSKFDGKQHRDLLPSEAIQIAGRAGRYGIFDKGAVACSEKQDQGFLRHLFKYGPEAAPKKAKLLPETDVLENFARLFPKKVPLRAILLKFQLLAQLDHAYRFSEDFETCIAVAAELDAIPLLTLKDRLVFIFAPVKLRSSLHMKTFLQFSYLFSLRRSVTVDLISVPSDDNIKALECAHDDLDLYLWLAMRFPEYFPEIEHCRAVRKEVVNRINESILSMGSYTPRRRRRRPDTYDLEEEADDEYVFNFRQSQPPATVED